MARVRGQVASWEIVHSLHDVGVTAVDGSGREGALVCAAPTPSSVNGALWMQVYLPIHLLPMLVFKWKLVKDNPGVAASALGRAIAGSVAFLLVYGNILKLCLCGLRSVRG
jgi:hypothetical protein